MQTAEALGTDADPFCPQLHGLLPQPTYRDRQSQTASRYISRQPPLDSNAIRRSWTLSRCRANYALILTSVTRAPRDPQSLASGSALRSATAQAVRAVE